jgi:hypothetical protein
MPVSTDVNLPKCHKPVFPDRCVACGAPGPDATYRAGTNAIGWWTLAFWVPGRRFSVDVPACTPCRRRMRRQWWVQLAVNAAVILAGCGVALFLLDGFQGALKRWLGLGVVLACLTPVVLWETYFPRPIDLTAYAKTVDYEFRDPEYAAEFSALNRPAEERRGAA